MTAEVMNFTTRRRSTPAPAASIGSMVVPTDDVAKVIRVFAALTQSDKRYILGYCDGLIAGRSEE